MKSGVTKHVTGTGLSKMNKNGPNNHPLNTGLGPDRRSVRIDESINASAVPGDAPAGEATPLIAKTNPVAIDPASFGLSGDDSDGLTRRESPGSWGDAVRRTFYWCLLAIVVGFITWVVVFVPYSFLTGRQLRRADVEVIPTQTVVLYAPVKGRFQLPARHHAGEWIKSGTVVGRVDSRWLRDEINSLRQRNLIGEQRLLQLAFRASSADTVDRMHDIDSEMRAVDQELRHQSNRLEELLQTQAECLLRASSSGWLLEDIPEESAVDEDQVIAKFVPASDDILVLVRAPHEVCVDLAQSHRGFVVCITTASAVTRCTARVDHSRPGQSYWVTTERGVKEPWACVYAHLVEVDEPIPPGSVGVIESVL